MWKHGNTEATIGSVLDVFSTLKLKKMGLHIFERARNGLIDSLLECALYILHSPNFVSKSIYSYDIYIDLYNPSF